MKYTCHCLSATKPFKCYETKNIAKLRNYSTSRRSAIFLSSMEKVSKSNTRNCASKMPYPQTSPRYRIINIYELTWWRHKTQIKRRRDFAEGSMEILQKPDQQMWGLKHHKCNEKWAILRKKRGKQFKFVIVAACQQQSIPSLAWIANICVCMYANKISWTNNLIIMNYSSFAFMNNTWTLLRFQAHNSSSRFGKLFLIMLMN